MQFLESQIEDPHWLTGIVPHITSATLWPVSNTQRPKLTPRTCRVHAGRVSRSELGSLYSLPQTWNEEVDPVMTLVEILYTNRLAKPRLTVLITGVLSGYPVL